MQSSSLPHTAEGAGRTSRADKARMYGIARGECEAILEPRGVWGWPESYNVGVHEGALDALEVDGGVDGEVRVRVMSLCDADLHIRWRPRV